MERRIESSDVTTVSTFSVLLDGHQASPGPCILPEAGQRNTRIRCCFPVNQLCPRTRTTSTLIVLVKFFFSFVDIELVIFTSILIAFYQAHPDIAQTIVLLRY